MKRIIGYVGLGVLMIVLITGCATNQQTGQAVGGVTGAIIGNQVGGGVGKGIATVVGAVVGAEVGGAVGANMDRQKPPAPVEIRPVYGWGGETPYPQCSSYYPGTAERAACERGARQRMIEEQRHRENEAYRRGLGR